MERLEYVESPRRARPATTSAASWSATGATATQKRAGQTGNRRGACPSFALGKLGPPSLKRVRPYVHRSVYALDPWLRSPISLGTDRERHGFTIGQVAWRLGVKLQEYRKLEAGERAPAFETRPRICKLYGWPQTLV